jgi:hypothetical protein
MRNSQGQITTETFNIAGQDAQGMRAFLQQFLPHGVVFSERRPKWLSSRREFTVTGPAAVMLQLRVVFAEAHNDVRIARSYGAR